MSSIKDRASVVEIQRKDAPRGEAAGAPAPETGSAPGARWRQPLMLGVPLILAAIGLYVYVTGGRFVSTDDAYVKTARVAISTDAPGRVVAVEVTENQAVKAGQVLFRLDPKPYEIALSEAEAKLETARLQVAALKANYARRESELRAARDTLAFQTRESERQRRLLAEGIASQSQYDAAAHAADQARQAVDTADHQLSAARADLGGDPGRPDDQHPMVVQARAQWERARLNLSYMEIRAPQDGTVTKVDQIQVGDYVQASSPVFALVSAQRPWIEANFKETDLTHMRPGQTASVKVDTYPGRVFKARVAAVSPGTGSSFSLLPPENATGNWVKVVQRVPVRLDFDEDVSGLALSAGLSAGVEVDTGRGHGPLDRALANDARPAASRTGP